MKEGDGRSIVMSEVMTPDKVNFSGNIHGGYVLSMLDKVAYACSARYSRQHVVTLSVDQVLFRNPIHVGDLVTYYASVNFVGRSSMEIGIKVVSENLQTQHHHHACSCFVTMIAVNANLKPIEVKPLSLDTDLQKRRFEDGKRRKELRLAYFNT